jgi:hypothetical protein
MRAFVSEKYGPAESLRMAEVEKLPRVPMKHWCACWQYRSIRRTGMRAKPFLFSRHCTQVHRQ